MTTFTTAERRQAGKALRDTVPRAAHAKWECRAEAPMRSPCSNTAIAADCASWSPCFGRMLGSPFTFLRGGPVLMAHDLSETPTTGITVQACGDCHLLNFGMFASPERNLVFDINDFDETLPAPWEWDVKRLATSFVVASRANGLEEESAREAACASVRSYRERMHVYAEMSPLDVWYSRVTADDLIARATDAKTRGRREKMAAKARRRVGESLLPKITDVEAGQHRFIDSLPTMTRITDQRVLAEVGEATRCYRESLAEERRVIFDRYRLEDFALRVVGIGSVATRCFVGLLFCDDKNPLFLQVKEARRSVLEPYASASRFDNQGQRVVVGQRLMQAASDIFLGWVRGAGGHDFYVRQLRDMKFSLPIESFGAAELHDYATLCGATLARAHARSGDPALISGYLGSSDKFDQAVAEFAVAYADQVERDHETLSHAADVGRRRSPRRGSIVRSSGHRPWCHCQQGGGRCSTPGAATQPRQIEQRAASRSSRC